MRHETADTGSCQTGEEASPEARGLRALERLAEMGERGDFDVLLDKRAYRPHPVVPPPLERPAAAPAGQ
ncbi:hypothetical protein [Streptomyces sp. TS71-3]|uniref:hypothetical protein n=1 Tax=Streptomyces sp. TS71-3 TaxID=2733862 RepID=UPI001B1ACBAC|nr:hypothetical protein [Streptomyces sp. TS71-3]GHJ37366.1 hypothetical protein Sm713_29750 [Streptomyces sp. TS71-3]